MKREKLEKYVAELSPEMQEKARNCKDVQELNALLAENCQYNWFSAYP